MQYLNRKSMQPYLQVSGNHIHQLVRKQENNNLGVQKMTVQEGTHQEHKQPTVLLAFKSRSLQLHVSMLAQKYTFSTVTCK